MRPRHPLCQLWPRIVPQRPDASPIIIAKTIGAVLDTLGIEKVQRAREGRREGDEEPAGQS
jgi:hypothetical protein